MTSSEPSENPRKGLHFTEVYCNFYWKDKKPHVLRNEIAENEEDDKNDSELTTKKQRLNDGQTSIRFFYKNKELEKGHSDEIHRSITKAFVMCNIPFSIIENPWFIDLIKTLQPGYNPLSRQVLSGTLLESETSRVNIRIMNELSADYCLWAFMLMTRSRKEYLLSLEDFSNIRHTGEHLSNVIEKVINKVEAKKFVAIVSDNGLNVAAAQLKAQLRKYLDQDNPYSAPYSNNDGPFQWRNLIIDRRSSLSRLAKIVFSITPHSASCERLFSALRWMFGKRRTNLNVQTIECMSKIYTHNIHSLSNSKRSLNHIGNSISINDVQKMIDNLFEEGDILNENKDEEKEYEEPPNIQKESVDKMLNIE
ncbi:ribonuclease H-like domain-containing protein [Rhizophagus irregularis DAOM 181602=DAOM 197198]|nr:ribonuclease H-like domain-containing protein [Rhizophagus irregularis DAOM 181602=DAOM 197198]